MKKKIKVIIKDPGKKPRCVWISNTLENLQKVVGGYIEAVTIASDMCIICNEEGRLRNLPYNCDICGVSFVGTIVFVGVSEDEFCSVPVDYKTLKAIMPKMWEDCKNGQV